LNEEEEEIDTGLKFLLFVGVVDLTLIEVDDKFCLFSVSLVFSTELVLLVKFDIYLI
jgi:hypothetical protein